LNLHYIKIDGMGLKQGRIIGWSKRNAC